MFKFIILSLMMLVAVSSHARVSKEVEVTLLDFHALIRMSPELRAYYLREVAGALADFEQAQHSRARLIAENQKFLEQLSALLLPQAHADLICRKGQVLFQGKCYNQDGMGAPALSNSLPTNQPSTTNSPIPTSPVQGSGAAPGAVADPGTVQPDKGSTPSGGADSSVKPSDPKAPAPADPKTPPATPAPNNNSLCHPKPTTAKCDKASREAVRSKFYSSFKENKTTPECVYGGYISKYDKDTPALNKCTPQSTIKIDQTSFTCPGNQTVCNPMVFGVQSGSTKDKTKPYCTGKTDNATADCDKQSTTKGADLEKTLNEMGIDKKWNDFKDNVKKVCSDVSGQFHCSECDIMNQRLLNAASKVKGDDAACNNMGGGSATPAAPGAPATPTGGQSDASK